ncbi:hypothetical protein CY35_07G031100 [Sphagnum magellanicum]|uniref:Uncharacterized protein n=1 Tax=Sphagnum magellanicum TaxID=128215 RepID=A0ACB8HK83_9BRYO|nr:hypothetical protein CY35_07G031100 [Sphagnum magellanicum]
MMRVVSVQSTVGQTATSFGIMIQQWNPQYGQCKARTLAFSQTTKQKSLCAYRIVQGRQQKRGLSFVASESVATHPQKLDGELPAISGVRESNSADTKPERSLKNEQELTVEEEARMREEVKARMSGIRSNAEKAKQMGSTRSTMQYSSVGVDLGDVRTGLSVSRGGFAPRPLSVVRQRGEKLLQHLLSIALQEKADEFVVGLPKYWDGKDSEQAHKVRSFAGRLANLAALRGSNRCSRKEQLDAYAAMAILCNYFEAGGASAQLILPKQLALQYLLLCQKPPQRSIADPDDDDFYDFVDDDDDF